MKSKQQPITTWEIIVGYIAHPKLLWRTLYTKWLITRAMSHQMTAQRFIDRSKKMMGSSFMPMLVSPTIGQYRDENLWIVEVPNSEGIRLYGMISENLNTLMSELNFLSPEMKVFVYDIASLRRFVVNDAEMRQAALHGIKRQEKARWN